MKFTLASLLLFASSKANEIPPANRIDFVGEGCYDYNADDPEWNIAVRSDDKSFAVDTDIKFDWYGKNYFPDVNGVTSNTTEIHISTNGILTFGVGYSDYHPDGFDLLSPSSSVDIIAPFWSDVNTDNSEAKGHIMWKSAGDGKFVVVWHEVTEYHYPEEAAPTAEIFESFYPESYQTDNITKTNTFQVVLSEPNHICFCYCKMEWAHADFYKFKKGVNELQYPATVGIRPNKNDMPAGAGPVVIGRFNHDLDTLDGNKWEGFGTIDNGVGHLNGRSYCFDTSIIEESDITSVLVEESGVCGDPHFKTWKGEHFEYHGQCDLVIAKDPKFADGLGLDVHIRTKLIRFWSYIKNAVIRIGDDILEIQGSTMEGVDKEVHYWINYEYQGDLTEFAGFPVTISSEGTKNNKNYIVIDLSSKYPGQKITLSTFKEFVKVNFGAASPEAFGNTVGMLGDYHTGKTVARDGATVLDSFAELGHEWQVLPSDGAFFREASDPTFPKKCIDPEDPRGERRRRLDESTISVEQAEAACAGLKSALDRKDCVYDILATQDLDMAGAF